MAPFAILINTATSTACYCGCDRLGFLTRILCPLLCSSNDSESLVGIFLDLFYSMLLCCANAPVAKPIANQYYIFLSIQF
jgi:hypothetical protein